jgi:hypothetical protein
VSDRGDTLTGEIAIRRAAEPQRDIGLAMRKTMDADIGQDLKLDAWKPIKDFAEMRRKKQIGNRTRADRG